jgi:lipopolysaccharide export system protein LptA
LKKTLLLIGFLILNVAFVFGQKASKIVIKNADFSDLNEIELPGVFLLTGNVIAVHDGVVLKCNKAYYYKDENYLKAFGAVQMVQGDTLYLNSKYAEYDGNLKKAFASGSVVMTSPESKMTTDTIHFDRNTQEAYFNTNGTIVNKNNTLKSKAGRYYVKDKKYQFLSAVELTNPEYVIKSNHLDYKTQQGASYLTGPSTIKGKETFIYTENGMYNSKTNIGHFLRKSSIKYKDRLIEADSLYYDRKQGFASGTDNVKITDSINKSVVRGHYGEVYRQKDSLFITKHASIRTLTEKDSMFIHAKKIIVTGKTGERTIRGFSNVRFFTKDMSGKCDSIHSSQKTRLTQLIGKPVLWNAENQLTGDLMHLIGEDKTDKLDSLKVLNNAFIVSKDTVGTGYNQVKGMNLYSKFRNNKIYQTDIVKNTEVIFYLRNDKQELVGIDKKVSSRINMIMDDQSKIESVTFFTNVEGDTYPENDLPENARKLRGFVWRGDERIKTKEEIFPEEEVALDKKIVAESAKRYEEGKLKQEIENNELEDHINGDALYEDIFKKYNNFIIIDKNGVMLLVRNNKFKFPANPNAGIKYKKNNPKFKKEINLDYKVWDWNTMIGKKFDGGLFFGNEDVEEIEVPKKNYLTYVEVFKYYNNRIVIDRNGMELLVQDGKFKFPANGNAVAKLKENNPKCKKVVKINQILWDWNTMFGKEYDGGLFNGNEVLEYIEIPEKLNFTYEELFKLYNNRLVIDSKGMELLVQDGKFKFPADENAINNFKKNNPKYKNRVKINQVLWDWNTMSGKKYDGGLFTGNEELGEIEVSKKINLTYKEIFEIYNNRLLIDSSGIELFVKDGKFRFPVDRESINNFRKKNPGNRNIVIVNQVLWDWNTMPGKEYDGGLFTGNEKY